MVPVDTAKGRTTIVLDRDGVINRKLGPRQYVSRPEQFEYVPGAVAALRRLTDCGFRLVVATVQMGIGLGLVGRDEVDAVHDWLVSDLAVSGVRIDRIYVCPHLDSDGCDCRKPQAGLLLRAAADLGFSPQDCWNVGDSPRDILMGLNAGCKNNLLVRSGYRPRPEELAAIAGTPECETLGEVADRIISETFR